MFHEDSTFAIMNTHILAGLIRNAHEEIILFTPGIEEAIAQELIMAKKRLPREKMHIIIDASEKICRFGYGTIEGLQLLQQEFTLRDSPGLRISGILVDGQGWVFSPTPLLIEAGKEDERQPNALRISKDQFLVLKQATLGEKQIRKEAGLPAPHATDHAESEKTDSEIGVRPVSPENTGKIAENLKINPPQKFGRVLD